MGVLAIALLAATIQPSSVSSTGPNVLTGSNTFTGVIQSAIVTNSGVLQTTTLVITGIATGITNHLVGKSYALMAQNTTAFFSPSGNLVTNLHAADVDMQTRQAVGTGFKVVGVWLKASQAPVGAQTYILTVMTNGTATACVATMTGAATTALDFTHAAAPSAQGDSIGVRIVSSATATTLTRFDWDVAYVNQ